MRRVRAENVVTVGVITSTELHTRIRASRSPFRYCVVRREKRKPTAIRTDREKPTDHYRPTRRYSRGARDRKTERAAADRSASKSDHEIIRETDRRNESVKRCRIVYHVPTANARATVRPPLDTYAHANCSRTADGTAARHSNLRIRRPGNRLLAFADVRVVSQSKRIIGFSRGRKTARAIVPPRSTCPGVTLEFSPFFFFFFYQGKTQRVIAFQGLVSRTQLLVCE